MGQTDRVRQRIKEAQTSWSTLSKRIEAIKHQLGLTLDEETKVVLQEKLDDLENSRANLQEELECLERELQSSQKNGAAVARSFHFFICYKRDIDPDQRLASFLGEFLSALGHTVFTDGLCGTNVGVRARSLQAGD